MVLPASHKVSRAPWYSGSVLSIFSFRLRGSHTLRQTFPSLSAKIPSTQYTVHTPSSVDSGLGYFPFARRYLGNHFCFLFLRVLRCFSSPSSPPITYFIQLWIPKHYSRWVPPFGHLRIYACLQLPVAFRSLPRPSSAPGAKASTLCS